MILRLNLAVGFKGRGNERPLSGSIVFYSKSSKAELLLNNFLSLLKFFWRGSSHLKDFAIRLL